MSVADPAHAACHEIVRIGRSLFERGYVHGTAGNISVRLDDGTVLITPSDACLGALAVERIARVDPEGRQSGGDRASKTLALHRTIYAASPEARCIVHTHATHLVALTLVGVWSEDDIVPPITPYQVMKVGHVPLIGYRRPGDPQVAELVRERIDAARARGTPIRAAMLDRLGPVVWHASPSEAAAVLEEMEETARLWLLSDRLAAPLDEPRIQALRDAFGAAW
jgi:ribulose-5-phosphate 4-epimerase/fuculose-1-phosphate aldolase